jgi:mono/diheme cytochrome c family protein
MILAIAGGSAALAAAALPMASADDTQAGAAAQIERGRYIVNTAGCHDCHTPWVIGPEGPEPDMSRMLSGHPQQLELPPAPKLPEGPWAVIISGSFTGWSGPWGVSYTANLTPDAETGLGRWTVENFKDTIRTGRRMGRGRPILPPMPIPVYQNLTDDDLEAVFAYLQTIPAIENRVPEPLPPPEAAPAD